MKVKASYKKIGLNPFKLKFADDDFYSKTVEVDDDFDLAELQKFAKEDTQKGYEFMRIEILGNSATVSPPNLTAS